MCRDLGCVETSYVVAVPGDACVGEAADGGQPGQTGCGRSATTVIGRRYRPRYGVASLSTIPVSQPVKKREIVTSEGVMMAHVARPRIMLGIADEAGAPLTGDPFIGAFVSLGSLLRRYLPRLEGRQLVVALSVPCRDYTAARFGRVGCYRGRRHSSTSRFMCSVTRPSDVPSRRD